VMHPPPEQGCGQAWAWSPAFSEIGGANSSARPVLFNYRINWCDRHNTPIAARICRG